MPRIEMRDAFGTSFRIDTVDMVMVHRWFSEWLPKLYPMDMDPEFGDPLIMSIYPIDVDGSGFDWPADIRFITMPFAIPRDPSKVMTAISARRAWIEEQIRKANGNSD